MLVSGYSEMKPFLPAINMKGAPTVFNDALDVAQQNLVEYIIATGPNTLEVHLRDGTVNTLEWKDRSRAESWTPEMREKAREHALRRHHG